MGNIYCHRYDTRLVDTVLVGAFLRPMILIDLRLWCSDHYCKYADIDRYVDNYCNIS
jgi:hypothetical protein